MTVYAIADLLTTAERRRAVSVRYYTRAGTSSPRTSGGYCPLGRALRLPRTAGAAYKAPSPSVIADRLVGRQGWGRGAVYAAAAEFTRPWDAGEIDPADLPAALGLELPS